VIANSLDHLWRIFDLHIRIEQTLHALGRRLGALNLRDRVGQFLHGELQEVDDLQKDREISQRHAAMKHGDSTEAQRQRGADAAH
jgi:hypothetical protein